MPEIKVFHIGDTVIKKNHACSKDAKKMLVIMAGSDVKVKCILCGREMIIPRVKLEKNIKNVVPKGEN